MKGWVKNLVLIIPYFIVVGMFQWIGCLVLGIDIDLEESDLSSFQTFIISCFDVVGTLLLLAVLMKWVDREKFIDLGFQLKNRGKDIVFGLGLGLIIMTIGYALLIAFDEISFSETNFNAEGILLSVGLFTSVAVVEEVLVRGYLLKNFMQSFNKYVALILSSAIFSLLHFFNPNSDFFSLFNIFLAGIFLGISYIYTKNLWFPIALHLSWNLFQSLYGFNVSGQDFYSIIEMKTNGINVLNGGNFGFEGSYLSTIAMLLSAGGVWMYYEKKKIMS